MVNFELRSHDALIENHRWPLRRRGFTLIELLVVLAIIALLLTVTIPRYFQSIDTAKETLLVDNLKTTREMIDRYYGDTGQYPTSLEVLVEKKYLRALPVDPISDVPWTLVLQEGEAKSAIYDIKSASVGKNRNGVLFSEL